MIARFQCLMTNPEQLSCLGRSAAKRCSLLSLFSFVNHDVLKVGSSSHTRFSDINRGNKTSLLFVLF
jgi:hypothetical protein